MPKTAQKLKFLDSYPVTAVNTFDTTSAMVHQALDLEIGKRPLTDLDIQRALKHQTWGRAIVMDYFANVLMSITVENRKILALIRYFKQHGLELAYERAQEYYDELRHRYHYTPPAEDEDEAKVKSLLQQLKRYAARLTLILVGLNALTIRLQADLFKEQRRYRQLKLAYAELSRDTTKQLASLQFARNLQLASLVTSLGLVINEEDHPHLFDFHAAEPTIQNKFIATLQDPEVYPNNAHLTAEDIRNLLFHPEVTKLLEKCQAQRQGYELRLEQKIDELYGSRMKCHMLENHLKTHQSKVHDVEQKLYKKNIELDAHQQSLNRADDPNPKMNQDISASIF